MFELRVTLRLNLCAKRFSILIWKFTECEISRTYKLPAKLKSMYLETT